jgi:outer membrane immunogenic protein
MSRIATLFVAFAVASPVGWASAADLMTIAPQTVVPPSPAFHWSGAYMGLSLGYGWASANQSYSISSATLAAAPPIIPVIDGSGSQNLSLRGASADVDVGYNWQLDERYVVGLEGDLALTGLSGSQSNGGNIPNYPPGFPYNVAQKLTSEVQGAIRAKVGYTPTDQLLVYLTGGPAIALLRYSSDFTDVFGENEGVSIHSWRPGWTIGGGAEYAISASWTVKGEYTYAQFSPAKAVGSTTLTDGTMAYGSHSTGTLKENTVRVGLNFHF